MVPSSCIYVSFIAGTSLSSPFLPILCRHNILWKLYAPAVRVHFQSRGRSKAKRYWVTLYWDEGMDRKAKVVGDLLCWRSGGEVGTLTGKGWELGEGKGCVQWYLRNVNFCVKRLKEDVCSWTESDMLPWLLWGGKKIFRINDMNVGESCEVITLVYCEDEEIDTTNNEYWLEVVWWFCSKWLFSFPSNNAIRTEVWYQFICNVLK